MYSTCTTVVPEQLYGTRYRYSSKTQGGADATGNILTSCLRIGRKLGKKGFHAFFMFSLYEIFLPAVSKALL